MGSNIRSRFLIMGRANISLYSVALILICLYAFIVESSSKCPTIKTKRNWGGKTAKAIDYQVIPINYVVIHHTVTNKCSTFKSCATIVKNIQDYHMNELGFDDIGYTFLIGNDGNVYEGSGWHITGAHTYGYNKNGTGIAFIGNFEDELPRPQALNAAKDLLECGVSKGELSRRYRLIGGRQAIGTVSPGLALYNEIQEWDNWVENP